MNWIFPEIKTTRSIHQRLDKITEELNELKCEIDKCDIENIEKESIDLYHSVETFLRLLFKDREKRLDEIVTKTIEKNEKRGYYNKGCF